MTDQPTPARLAVSRFQDSHGTAKGFLLQHGNETIRLDPGKSWAQVDVFKWVTRGVIEAPQSFHVLTDGGVDYNGVRVSLGQSDAVHLLEHEVNKRHAVSQVQPLAAAPKIRRSHEAESAPSGPVKIRFHVKLDHLGHTAIECLHGGEKTLTGLRGLAALVQSGLMLRPNELHVDPLQRAVEIDGNRFACDAEGLAALESVLNERYAPLLQSSAESAIHIRENAASSTGFDMQFTTLRAGVRFEVKGHLSQEHLDLLQDRTKSDLLRPGLVIRLSPPLMLFRQRRADGGEEKIAEVPDIHYLHTNALQLEQIFNHPLLRGKTPQAEGTAGIAPIDIRAVERPTHEASASPRPQLDPKPVSSTSPRAVSHKPAPVIEHTDWQGDSAGDKATRLNPAATVAATQSDPAEAPKLDAPTTPADPAVVKPSGQTAEELRVAAAYGKEASDGVMHSVFDSLKENLGLAPFEAVLSVPRIFTDRRFEILSFSHTAVESVFVLRGTLFHGFYLAHYGEAHTVLVYAKEGRHVEWGDQKCELQCAAAAEFEEFRGGALLGVARRRGEELGFVFVVIPAYLEWAKARLAHFRDAGIGFMRPEDAARAAAELEPIWPKW